MKKSDDELHYMVFDGRAHYDLSRAACHCVIGPMSENKAVEEFKRDWEDMGAVLMSYECDESDTLTNGIIIRG